ncbi:MAG: hypothetical protein KC420_09375, partial [Myxococcales bacterium]|nr:hypothetical protein [Myxococcales bacterium]
FNRSDRFQRAAKSFSETLILRCLDTPDGKDCTATFTFERGRCVRHTYAEADAPSAMRRQPFDKGQALARSTAPYELWVRLDRGEINVAQALVSPSYQVEGSKLKIMRHVGVLTAMNAVVAGIPKSY